MLAWEFGSNWGHLATLMPLAQGLRSRGHDVVFAVRGLDGDLSLLAAGGFDYLPMPIAIAPLQQMHKILVRGYADVLARGGFADVRTLMQLATAWRGILHCVNPDVVICKYSPLAEFATRDRPVLSVGTGFEMPPLTKPLPSYSFLSLQDREALSAVEEKIREAINAQNTFAKSPPFESVGHAFAHCERILLTWPQLDHFGARPDGDYFGAVEDLSALTKNHSDLESFIRNSSGPATFAYLRVGVDWLRAFLDAIPIQKQSRSFIIVDPTLTRADCEILSNRKYLVMNQAINLKSLMPHLDTIICHAGHGTVMASMVCSKRLLMLPQYMEQIMLAKRVISSQPANAGVALMMAPLQPVQVAEVHASLLKMEPPHKLISLCDNPIQELAIRIEAIASEH